MKKILLFLLFSLLPAQVALAQTVAMVESYAFIKNNALEVSMIFNNTSEQQKGVTINTSYLGQMDTLVETVPGNSTKSLTYKISSIKPGELRFAVLADKNTFMKIVVPEDVTERDVLLVREISAEEWKKSLGEEGPFSKLAAAFNHLLASPDAVAIATVLLMAVTVLLAVKIAFRDKSAAEKKVEMNEKLLREAERIKERRGLGKKFKP